MYNSRSYLYFKMKQEESEWNYDSEYSWNKTADILFD